MGGKKMIGFSIGTTIVSAMVPLLIKSKALQHVFLVVFWIALLVMVFLILRFVINLFDDPAEKARAEARQRAIEEARAEGKLRSPPPPRSDHTP